MGTHKNRLKETVFLSTQIYVYAEKCLFGPMFHLTFRKIFSAIYHHYAHAQADLRLCWSHISLCWKSHVAAHMQLSIGGRDLKFGQNVHLGHVCV